MLIEQRQTNDVSRICQKDQTIRELNGEIARLQDTVTEMKAHLQKVLTKEASKIGGNT